MFSAVASLSSPHWSRVGRGAGRLFQPTIGRPPLPQPAAVSVCPGTNLAPVPVVLGDATLCLSVWSLPSRNKTLRKEGRSPKIQFAGTPIPTGRLPRPKGRAAPPSPPLALNASCYWPKVSAPSGKLTSHWPARGHMTALFSEAGNQGRQQQVQLQSESRAGPGKPLARRGSWVCRGAEGHGRGRVGLRRGPTELLVTAGLGKGDHGRLFPKQELALSPPGEDWP